MQSLAPATAFTPPAPDAARGVAISGLRLGPIALAMPTTAGPALPATSHDATAPGQALAVPPAPSFGVGVGARQFPRRVAMAEERSRTPSLDVGASLDAAASSDGLSWEDPAADDEVEGFGDEVAYAEHDRYRVERLLISGHCPATVSITCRFALAGGEEVYEMSPASMLFDLRQHIQALRCISAEVKVQLFAANTKRRLPLDASLLINFIGYPGWLAELALRLDVVLIPPSLSVCVYCYWMLSASPALDGVRTLQ